MRQQVGTHALLITTSMNSPVSVQQRDLVVLLRQGSSILATMSDLLRCLSIFLLSQGARTAGCEAGRKANVCPIASHGRLSKIDSIPGVDPKALVDVSVFQIFQPGAHISCGAAPWQRNSSRLWHIPSICQPYRSRAPSLKPLNHISPSPHIPPSPSHATATPPCQ